MAQATFSVRMDESLKRQFDSLCQEFGMNASTANNVFAGTVVRERKIPFEISSPEADITREGALQAYKALRAQARESKPEMAIFCVCHIHYPPNLKSQIATSDFHIPLSSVEIETVPEILRYYILPLHLITLFYLISQHEISSLLQRVGKIAFHKLHKL